MDDIILRQRYPRYRTQRRKKHARDTNDFRYRITTQTVICVVILALAGFVKVVDTPATNYAAQLLKKSLSSSIELKGIYEGMNNILRALDSGRDKKGIPESDFEQDAVPASVIGAEETQKAESREKKEDFQDNSDKKTESLGDGASKPSRSENVEAAGSQAVSQARMIVPVEGTLGSPYGQRIHPIKKANEFHRGIDIEADNGVPIKAALEGEVQEAGCEKTFGNYVKLRHAGGLTTVYAHCSVLNVNKGQKVKQGEVIAKVGDTGASVGAHLHFEVWKDGKHTDPLQYINVPRN